MIETHINRNGKLLASSSCKSFSTQVILFFLFLHSTLATIYSQTIIEESKYSDCSASSSSILEENKWTQQSDISSSFNAQCITTCGTIGAILGPFTPQTKLTRRFFLSSSHESVRITGTFLKIDGWSLGQQLIIEANEKQVYTWEFTGEDILDTNYCDIGLSSTSDHIETFTLSIPHTSNLITISISVQNSNSESISAWGIQKFHLAIESSSSSTAVNNNTSSTSLPTLNFTLITDSQLPRVDDLPEFKISFSNDLLTPLTSTDFTIELEGIDSNSFTTQLLTLDARTFKVRFTTANFTTIYGTTITVTLSNPIYDISGIALQTLRQDALASPYYNYTPNERTAMLIFSIFTKYASILIMVLTALLTILFDRFNWLLYCIDIGQILYISKFINVTFPWNIQLVLNECATFLLQTGINVFDPIISDNDRLEQQPYFTHFSELGLTSLFASNAGNLIIMIIASLFVFCVFSILSYPMAGLNASIREKMQEIIETRFKWRLFLAIAYFSYAQVLFAGLLQIFTWSTRSLVSVLSIAFALLSLIFAVIAPVIFYKLITSKHAQQTRTTTSTPTNDEEDQVIKEQLNIDFQRRFGLAWQDLRNPNEIQENNAYSSIPNTARDIIINNNNKNESIPNQSTSTNRFRIFTTSQFYLVLLLRRGFYSCIVILFQFNANLQIALLNMCNVTIIFVVLFLMPFKKQRNNYKVIATELILVVEYMIMQSYQNEQENESSRMFRGWILTAATSSILLIQLVFLSLDIIDALSTYYSEYLNRKNSLLLSATTAITKSQLTHPITNKNTSAIHKKNISQINSNHSKDNIKQLRVLPTRDKSSSAQILPTSPKFPISSSHTILMRDSKHKRGEPTSSFSLTKQQTYRSQFPRSSESTAIGEAQSHLFKHGSLNSRGGYSSQSEAFHNQLSLNLSPNNNQNQMVIPYNKKNTPEVEIDDYNIQSSKATPPNTSAFQKQSPIRISPSQSPKTAVLSSLQDTLPFFLKPSRVETTTTMNPTTTQPQNMTSSPSLTNIEPITSTMHQNSIQTSFNLLSNNHQEKTTLFAHNNNNNNNNSPQTMRTQENGSLTHIPEIENQPASNNNNNDQDESQNLSHSHPLPSLTSPDVINVEPATAAATATIAVNFNPSSSTSISLNQKQEQMPRISLTLIADQPEATTKALCPSIQITTSEKVIPGEFNENDNENENETENENDQAQIDDSNSNNDNLMKIPLRFLALRKFQKAYQIIHEQPGEENGSIMGMSSHIPESPLDMNPDRNRTFMLSSFLNTPQSRNGIPRKQSESIAEIELDTSNEHKQKSLGQINDGDKTPNIPNSPAALSPFSIAESMSIPTPSLNIINEEPNLEDSKASPLKRPQKQMLKKSKFSGSKTQID